MKKILIFLIPFLIFFFSWFVVYRLGINTLPIQSEDTVPSIFLPLTIINKNTLYLNRYYNTMISRYPHPDDKDHREGLVPYYLVKINKNYLSAFPIITPIISIPIYLIPILLNVNFNWDSLIIISHLSASFIVSLSGYFFYLLIKKHFNLSEYKQYLLWFIYLFCSVNFAMLSQSLWQHGTVELFLILTLYSILNYKRENKYIYLFLSGFFFLIGFLARPTALSGIFLFLILLFDENFKLVKAKKLFDITTGVISGFTFPFMFYIWYSETFYFGISSQGYSSQLNSWLSPFPMGFLGMWFSPSKGIITYSPIFIFSFVSIYLLNKLLRNLNKEDKNKNKNKNKDNDKNSKLNINKETKNIFTVDYRKSDIYTYLILLFIVLLHTLIMSLWKHWYGGYGFGYRMASDIIPFLTLLIIPFVNSIYYEKYKKVFIFLLIFSLFVQIFGIIFFDGIWHNAYDNGFRDTSWLWSIKDSEFVFNIRRVLVKLGYLNKACDVCLPN